MELLAIKKHKSEDNAMGTRPLEGKGLTVNVKCIGSHNVYDRRSRI